MRPYASPMPQFKKSDSTELYSSDRAVSQSSAPSGMSRQQRLPCLFLIHDPANHLHRISCGGAGFASFRALHEHLKQKHLERKILPDETMGRVTQIQLDMVKKLSRQPSDKTRWKNMYAIVTGVRPEHAPDPWPPSSAQLKELAIRPPPAFVEELMRHIPPADERNGLTGGLNREAADLCGQVPAFIEAATIYLAKYSNATTSQEAWHESEEEYPPTSSADSSATPSSPLGDCDSTENIARSPVTPTRHTTQNINNDSADIRPGMESYENVWFIANPAQNLSSDQEFQYHQSS